MNARRRLLLVLAATAAAGACSEPQPKPKPAPPPPDEEPRLGVVAHIAQVKERALTRDNWKGFIGGLFTQDMEASVVSVHYEVTVFFDDSSTGVVTVDQKPTYAPGQRVRVTGNRIEAMRR